MNFWQRTASAEIVASEPLCLMYPRAGDHFSRAAFINGVGWIAGAGKLDVVHILLDGRPVDRARFGLASDDLMLLAGETPPASCNGFVFSIPASLALGESPMLEIRAVAADGLRVLRRQLSVEPAADAPPSTVWERLRPPPQRLIAHAARPIWSAHPPQPGASAEILEWEWHLTPVDDQGPLVLAEASKETSSIRLVCEEAMLLPEGMVTVKGWAVSPHGIVELRVEIDDVLVGTVVPDELRADVGRAYPAIPSAERAGFRLSRRMFMHFGGEHTLILVARDGAGQQARVEHRLGANGASGTEHCIDDDIRRTDQTANAVARPIRAYLDQPRIRDGRAVGTLHGSMTIAGWAFSPAGIRTIEVFVDGASQGPAYYGARREDVLAAFPDCPTPRPGFAMVIAPEAMQIGMRGIRVVITDHADACEAFSFTADIAPVTLVTGPWNLRSRVPLADIAVQRALVARHGPAPSWHVLIPVLAIDPALLGASLRSLINQALVGWSATLLVSREAELSAIHAMMREGCMAGDARLQVAVYPETALLSDLVHGANLVLFLAPGDRLGEDALLELSAEAAMQPDADFFYSDERRRDPADGAVKAFFKPDFSPDLLLATNYIGRLWAVRHGLLACARITLGDLAMFGEWDAVLRLTEHAQGVAHVPHVLCERVNSRATPRRDRVVLDRAMDRRGITADIVPGAVPGSYQLRRAIPTLERVSIIVPTAGVRGLVEVTLRLIRAVTDWPDYEIICLDNIPNDEAAEHRRLKAELRARADAVLEIGEAFNWSRFNNAAVARASGAYLLFLNDDIEIDDPHWLRRLVEQAQRPEIGVVGARLLYPDGRVQHAGMFLTARSARHAFRMLPGDAPGAFGLARTQREVVSVTGACMMMRREVFDRLDGFDESHAVVNNDLDFNLRAQRAGLRVVYTPDVTLTHHEMISRAALPDTYDVGSFHATWGGWFAAGDPFHNPNLSRDVDDYVPTSEPVLVGTSGRPLAARTDVRRILVVKLDHLGDFITTFPALRRLRAHFPATEIVVLTASASLAWAKLEPAIDRVIGFDFFHARSSKGKRLVARAEMDALAAQLAGENFDLALDLRRQPETRSVLQRCGARWRAGFDRGNAHEWLDVAVEFEGDIARQRKRSHVSDALLRLVDAVAEQFTDDRDIVQLRPPRAEGRQALYDLLEPWQTPLLAPGRRLVCIHPGAGAANKQWPLESFAGLIDVLAERGLTLVVIGGADEARMVARLLRGVRRADAVINLVGRVGLAALPNIFGAMDLFVGNDSGPKHLAAGIGVPTIGIHSGTVDAGEWGAVGSTAVTIRRDMVCSPCYLADIRDCHRGLACLTGIAVSDVYRACRRLLGLS